MTEILHYLINLGKSQKRIADKSEKKNHAKLV